MSSSQERTARTFVERHGLWNDAQFAAAADVDKLIEDHKLEVVRPGYEAQDLDFEGTPGREVQLKVSLDED